MLFESLLFLKQNRRFWNLEMCVKASMMAKTERAKNRITADTIQEEMEEAMDELAG